MVRGLVIPIHGSQYKYCHNLYAIIISKKNAGVGRHETPNSPGLAARVLTSWGHPCKCFWDLHLAMFGRCIQGHVTLEQE